MHRFFLTSAAATLLLALFATASSAQQGAPRELAPGVMTVIPRSLEAEETFSGPRQFVDLSAVAEEWQPNTIPESMILAELADDTIFRNSVWQVEFAFKPLRMMEIEVPQPNGRLERKNIWYLIFRVRNPGAHLSPAPGAWARDENGELITRTETVEVDPASGQALQIEGAAEFALDPNSETLPRETPHVAREVDFKVRCFPMLALHSLDGDKEYLDRLIPTAISAIQQREDPNTPLLSTIEIGQRWLEVDTDPEGGTWGVATWEDVDPDTDFLTISVEGLTDAFRWLEPGEGSPPVEEFTYSEKVLQLNFWRPGDRYLETESEIHYGMPPEGVSRPGLNLNELYGVPGRVDYLWIYQ